MSLCSIQHNKNAAVDLLQCASQMCKGRKRTCCLSSCSSSSSCACSWRNFTAALSAAFLFSCSSSSFCALCTR